MVKSNISRDKIQLRPAKASDAKAAGRLLFDSFPKLATFTIGLGDEARAKDILTRIFTKKGHRFSYEVAEMVQIQGKVVGVIIAFPGRKLGKYNRRLGKVLFSQYQLRGKLALLLRTFPLFFINEAKDDEFYLSNLAIIKNQRSRGIGGLVLEYVDARARNLGLDKAALMVSIDNQRARRFYERHGYSVKAIHLESNQRVRYVGPGYQRMVKELSE